jgi:hypothetical protein
LASIENLEVIVNGEYKTRVDKLQEKARTTTYDARNPVFRVLQILGTFETSKEAGVKGPTAAIARDQ